MKKVRSISLLLAGVVGLALSIGSTVVAHERTVVVPLGGSVGDATVSDVVKGKTFSSKAAGKGVTGTLELPPTAQSYTNTNNMTFNLIPAGTFTMGSPDDEPGGPYPSSELPQHQVILSKSFYMQTTEVTQKQWEDVMHTNPAGSNTGAEYPLETVNWFEAVYFANELSALESPARIPCYDLSACSGSFGSTYTCSAVGINPNCTGYRLPTEAEWKYAARATTTPWAYAVSYDDSADPGDVNGGGFNSNLDAMGWYIFNNTTQYATDTKPVAKKQANKWGLYDMAGNVWEWCQDWYDSAYYSDPESTSDPQGPDTAPDRVVRGGGWFHSAGFARSAYRNHSTPGLRSVMLGFRLVFPSGR